MSFLSTSLRASFVLLLLAGAPRAGHAAPAAGPAPCTPIVAQAKAAPAAASHEPAVAQEPPVQPATAPQLTLQFGPFQLRYCAHPDHPTLLDRLLFGSRVATLARQVASGNGPHLPF